MTGGTNRENVQRGYFATTPVCPQGHPYSGDNLHINATSGARVCRTCSHWANKRSNEAKKARRGAAA